MEGVDLSTLCTIGPNEELLKAVEWNNFDVFETVMKNSKVDLSYEYTEPYPGTILDICCTLPHKKKFIKLLLSSGVDVNRLNRVQNKAPIHLAATNRDKEALRLLVDHPQTDINLTDGDGNTALHILTMTGEMDVSEYLLTYSKDVNPNLLNENGASPAYMVATSSEKNEGLMAFYLRCSRVDFDMIVRGKPLREVVERNYPHIFPFKYLYTKNTDRFVSYITSNNCTATTLESNDGQDTYLQRACKFGLTAVVRVLLDLGVNPNGTIKKNRTYPLFIAATKGFADIIQLFIDCNHPQIIYQMYESNSTPRSGYICACYTSALHELIRNSRSRPKDNVELCDYGRSFHLLLPICSELDINYVDHLGNTCLHEAAAVTNRNFIFSLLDNGAYMALMNNNGVCLLDLINHNTLEAYLNKCILSNENTSRVFNFDIKFAYTFLCPPKIRYDKNDDNYRHAHYPKAFLASITETYPLICLSKIPELSPLLVHPVLSSIVYIKWSRIVKYYYLNLVIYMIFLFWLTMTILMTFKYNNDLYKTARKYHILPPGATLYYVVIYICVLAINNVYNLVASVFSPNHNVSWQSLGLVCLFCIRILTTNSDDVKEIRILTSVLIILVSWVELLIILGKHPKFSNPLMALKVATKNFFTYLSFYSLLIIAFQLSLFMSFHKVQDDVVIQNDHPFRNIYETAFKIIVMLTGELDAYSESFLSDNEIGRMVFVLFIFFIPIILINLLNGVAVSDINEIRKNEEYIAVMARLKYVYSFENCFISNVLEIDKRRTCWLFRMLGIKLRLFPDILRNRGFKFDPNISNQATDLTKNRNRIENIKLSDELEALIAEKSKSIIKLNSEARQGNDELIDFLAVKVVKIDSVVTAVEKLGTQVVAVENSLLSEIGKIDSKVAEIKRSLVTKVEMKDSLVTAVEK